MKIILRVNFQVVKFLENENTLNFILSIGLKSNISLLISNDNSLIYDKRNNKKDIRIGIDIYYPLQFNI